MSTTIAPGQQIEIDGFDWVVQYFSWEDHLAPGVQLLDEGVFTITCVSDPTEDPVVLVVDSITVVPGTRKVQFRVKGGTPGYLYNIAHQIYAVSVPIERRERSFFISVLEK